MPRRPGKPQPVLTAAQSYALASIVRREQGKLWETDGMPPRSRHNVLTLEKLETLGLIKYAEDTPWVRWFIGAYVSTDQGRALVAERWPSPQRSPSDHLTST